MSANNNDPSLVESKKLICPCLCNDILISNLNRIIFYAFNHPFLRYSFCGGIATIFDWYSFYLSIYILNLNYLVGITISFTIGSLVNFSLNKVIAFKNNHKNYTFQFAVYLSGAISSLFLTGLMMILFIEYFHYGPMGSRIIITIITLLFNYTFHKFITFGKLK